MARREGWCPDGSACVSGPLVVGGSASVADVRATNAATGNTYGGRTSQGMPVVVEMSANRRKIVRAVAVVELTCTSGSGIVIPDEYTRLPVSRSGRFSVRFGPVTQRNDDGTTIDLEGRMSGRLNSTKTRITGTWQFKATDHDATGAVTDTCDSGSVSWRAKQ